MDDYDLDDDYADDLDEFDDFDDESENDTDDDADMIDDEEIESAGLYDGRFDKEYGSTLPGVSYGASMNLSELTDEQLELYESSYYAGYDMGIKNED